MRLKAVTATALMLLLPGLAGCGTSSAPRQVSVTMTDNKFTPTQVQVKAGEAVQFQLTNQGSAEHEYESTSGKFEELKVPAGMSRTATWKAPDQTGDYEFDCDLHPGMSMIVRVTK